MTRLNEIADKYSSIADFFADMTFTTLMVGMLIVALILSPILIYTLCKIVWNYKYVFRFINRKFKEMN